MQNVELYVHIYFVPTRDLSSGFPDKV